MAEGVRAEFVFVDRLGGQLAHLRDQLLLLGLTRSTLPGHE